MRIYNMITKGKMLWSFIKASHQLILFLREWIVISLENLCLNIGA